jgi:hypothetical protein
MIVCLTGLHIKPDRPTCCENICVIGPSKGPHGARLDCADCGNFRGWLDKGTLCWIESVVLFSIMPPAQIDLHKARIIDGPAVDERERQRRIHEINQRIISAGLKRADFLLSWQPTNDWFRNQQRHKIAQLLARYRLTAHDLIPRYSSFRPDIGAVGEGKVSAPRKLAIMDMSEFAGSRYLRASDLKEQGGFKAKIVAVERDKKFGKANVHLPKGAP